MNINLKIVPEDQPDFFGEIIDVFEHFLEARGVSIPSSEKDKRENDPDWETNPYRIWGDDYYELRSDIESMLKSWSVSEKEAYVSHYQILLRNYFTDATVQGQIQKRGAFKEAEWVLENLYDVWSDERKAIYDAEYQNSVQM